MGDDLYADAEHYDLMFPGGGPAVEFFRAQAGEPGRRVLELGCGTGDKLIPVASDGHACVGLDAAPEMLAEARRKALRAGVEVEWIEGDVRAFDLGRTFDLIFSGGNALLHLHRAEDLVACFRGVRRHLEPGGRFAFDVFNPSIQILAAADGVRRPREALWFTDPLRGAVTVDAVETYDAAAQVTRGTWFLSTADQPDFRVIQLEIRSIFPQELPLLLNMAGLRLVERLGDWSREPFSAESPRQVCVCEPA